ncbi:hypothetical protein Sjap_003385 [Stephania japonica]|uniref:Uncharacterized protein n=1 Tax=Stephania japonica TaxID=461633 RepID=A0AAP0PV05_9MAGN
MAKQLAALVCLLVLALDINAGILGIEAEIAQNKVKHVRFLIFECRDPSQKAFKLGVAAIVLLGLAHVVANLFGGFVCICSRDELDRASANKQLATSCLVLSWIVLLVAFSLLIIGTMTNSKSKGSCGISHHRYLSVGGILCFIHALFAVSYYVSAIAITDEGRKMNERPVGGSQMAARPHQGDLV